jgi:23S rRNA (uracil1939-C5)-methyltransferase
MKKIRSVEQLKVTGISADGKAIGKKNKLVVFVKGGAPGDVIDVRIIGKDKKFLVGKPERFHKKSEERVEPFCRHFNLCGGCKWQHLSYEAQLKHKHEHVISNLKKLSGMKLPEPGFIMGSAETTYYRNKLEFTFSNKRWLTQEEIKEKKEHNRNALGFHIPKNFDKILHIDHCHLQSDPSNAIRLAVHDYAQQKGLSYFDIRAQDGLLRNLIIRTSTTGQIMVIVQFAVYDRASIYDLMNFLKEEFPEITSLQYVVNEKKNDTFYDLPVVSFHGEDFIEEKMDDLTFRIGPKSFYQTNSLQAHELYKKVREFAGLTGRS